jgi:hypothetical protein
MKLLALLGALALTGCAAAPATAPPIAHPLAGTVGAGWRAPRPADEIVLDTRAFQAALDSDAPGPSLNRNGKPRIALWLGVATAGIIYLNALDELADDFVDCLFGLGDDCDND